MDGVLDVLGSVTLALQIIIMFLLLIGVTFAKVKARRENLMVHGYVTAVALVLHTTLIVLVMVPSLFVNLASVSRYPIWASSVVWFHVITGVAAEVLGIALVSWWVYHSPGKLTCVKRKRWMMPTFVVWSFSLALGVIIQVSIM